MNRPVLGERGEVALSDQLQVVLESIRDPFISYDASWRIICMNSPAELLCRALGRSPEQLMGRVVWDAFPGLRATAFYSEAMRAMAEQRTVEFEAHLAPLDRWFEVRCYPRPDGLISYTRDITAHKRSEAASAALAAENARLYKAERKARRAVQRAGARAARLHAVTAAFSSALAPSEVAAVVVDQGMAAMNAYAGSIALLNARGDALDVVAMVGYTPEVAGDFQRIPLDAHVPLADVARTGKPVWLRSYEERDARYPNLAQSRRAADASAMAAVPLTVRGRTIGAMGLNFHDPQPFTGADVAFILALTQQCAQALDRAQLYEAERAARAHAERLQQRFAFLADVGELLITSLDYEATLANVAQLAVPRIADCCVVFVREQDDTIRRVGVVAADPATEILLQNMEQRFATGHAVDDNVVARVIRSGEPAFLPEVTDAVLQTMAADPEYRALLGALGLTSTMIVPLPGRTGALGALALGAITRRPYDAGDLALATELARRAGMAVDHALLYRDTTRARQEAEVANRTKAEFLATMSHELRTPLNAIGGYVELLTMELRGPITDAQREDLRRIDRNQRYLLGLINDVLNFARLENGRVPLALAAVPLDEVLAGLEVLIAPQMEAKGLGYTYRPGDRTITVHADAERLQQIVLNLLSNAVKFTERGGTVMLDWKSEGSLIAVRVEDTGCGIPPEKLQVIFEPFVQLDQGYRRTTDGTGLGLAISRDLARAMGGDLTAHSVHGEGSVFTLVLPRGNGR